jgi:16S rRNA (cytidine1402-2'-O)-methyltransferase
MVSLHAHNEAAREGKILGWLAEGKELALVSDAGTPLVSDPGYRLVGAVLEAGHRVVPIPGPSAVLAALVGSGLSLERFSFQGFPPRKGKERTDFLERVASFGETTVLFESPERLVSLLADLSEITGENRRGAVARELTKVHEEFVRGSLAELREHFQAVPPRGEITLVLEAGPIAGSSENVDAEAATALARVLLGKGMRPSQTAREVARRLGISRNQAYELVQGFASDGDEGTG